MVTVIVTIHGIGFQVPPDDTPPPGNQRVPGYADALHEHLRDPLGEDVLGDDPDRFANGVRGPVYVHSHWPPGSRKIEEGIERLGKWLPDVRPGKVDMTKKFVDGDEKVAHVALVYANLEEKISAAGP